MHFERLSLFSKIKNNIWFYLLSIIISLIFINTGDIQEDALIVFRTARNFSEYGDFSFNIGESNPSISSLIYGIYTAFIFKITSIFNYDLRIFLTIFISGNFFILSFINFIESYSLKRFFNPFFIIISSSYLNFIHLGMDVTFSLAIFLFLLSNFFHNNQIKNNFIKNGLLIILLIALRIDNILYLFSLLISILIIKRHKFISSDKFDNLLKTIIIFSILGVSINFLINKFFYGTLIPHTALAKIAAYGFGDKSYYYQFIKYFITNSFLLPISTKYVFLISPFMFPLLIFSIYQLNKRVVKGSYKSDNAQLIFIISSCLSIIPPLIYCFSSIIFPWYLWISSFFAWIIIIWYLTTIQNSIKKIKIENIFKFILILFLLLELITSISKGIQNQLYLRNIGLYINQISLESDLMMLEPAGYIPFYARTKIIDNTGLTSREFTNFLKEKKKNSSIYSFIQKKQPDLILKREIEMIHNIDSLGNSMSDQEINWFENNYTFLKKFKYEPEVIIKKNLILKNIANFGSHPNFYLYSKIK